MSETERNGSQVITCKAAICWGSGEPIVLEEIQVDPPKSSEIRVKMLYASLCKSDYLFQYQFPLVLGHEGVGVVESIGDEVKDVKEGELVIPRFIRECKECENCKSGKTNLCLKDLSPVNGLMPDGTSRLSVRGQKLYHFASCSTWSEYMVIDVSYVIKIDPTLSLPHASFLSCGFSTGFGSAWKVAEVEKGSSVAVIGLGAVGLGAIEAARIQGANKIIGVDNNERKKEKGKAFGMTEFINSEGSEKSISELIKDLTDGLGVDYCFDCSGANLINQALLATKSGIGKTIAVGSGTETDVQISLLHLLYGGTLKGCIFGGLVKTDFPFLFDKCNKKELHLDELLTHEISLEDIYKVFEIMKQPDCVKVLIKIQ